MAHYTRAGQLVWARSISVKDGPTIVKGLMTTPDGGLVLLGQTDGSLQTADGDAGSGDWQRPGGPFLIKLWQ